MTATEIVATTDSMTAALEAMDAAGREAAVTQYLTDARNRLAVALQATGPAAVAAIKAEVATAAEATKQLGLSREIQHDAQEMVRRAEFALGKAIRAGQERGEIRRRGEREAPIAPYVRVQNGVERSVAGERRQPESTSKPGPNDFASPSELHGARADGIYAMTDGVTDTAFEAALTDAKTEGNLSRTNVVRKIHGVKQDGLTATERLTRVREMAASGHTSDQIGREVGLSEQYVRDRARVLGIEIPADKVMRGTRRLNHTKFVNETVTALEGLASGLDVLDLNQVDRSQVQNWSISLTESLRALNRLAKQIKEMDQ